MVETVKANGLAPMKYIKYILAEMRRSTVSDQTTAD